jgi:hypothetical protein
VDNNIKVIYLLKMQGAEQPDKIEKVLLMGR